VINGKGHDLSAQSRYLIAKSRILAFLVTAHAEEAFSLTKTLDFSANRFQMLNLLSLPTLSSKVQEWLTLRDLGDYFGTAGFALSTRGLQILNTRFAFLARNTS
jgi:hypothetical protein